MLPPATIFRYQGNTSKPDGSACNLWLNRALHLALVEDRGEGTSVTNAAEQIATQVMRRYCLNPHKLLWLEAYYLGQPEEYYTLVHFTYHASTNSLHSARFEYCDLSYAKSLAATLFVSKPLS